MTATGTLHELDRTGDTRTMWDKNIPEEVEIARATFDSLKAKGYLIYKAVGAKGVKGEVMSEFDPEAERIIAQKPNVGG